MTMSRKKRNSKVGFLKFFQKHAGNRKDDADKEKMELVLRHKDELPLPLRSVLDREVARNHKKPKTFLFEVECGLFRWIMDNGNGLNDNRDTHDQVELALHFFPTVLERRNGTHFPLNYLFRSIRSVSFVPLFAKVGHELGVFRPNERGGLIFGKAMDVFQQLAGGCGSVLDDDTVGQEVVDRKLLEVIKELRNENLMNKSDIEEYQMIRILCGQRCFPKERFLYLVDWNPRSLLFHGKSALDDGMAIAPWIAHRFFERAEHYKVGNRHLETKCETRSLVWTEIIFGVLCKYYPSDLGFLFDKTCRFCDTEDDPSHGREAQKVIFLSPFELACREHGRERILTLLASLLYHQMRRDVNFTKKALIRLASSHGKDGIEPIFFLIQQEPLFFRQQPKNNNCASMEQDRIEPRIIERIGGEEAP